MDGRIKFEANDTMSYAKEVEVEVDWKEIIGQLKKNNVNFIKDQISSKKVRVNAQHPDNGRTLLIYAVINGNFDLVKAICNAGADVAIKDKQGRDALHYAMQFGRYKVTKLIFYRTLSGKTGEDLKNISTQIHTLNKEAEYIKNQTVDVSYSDKKVHQYITQLMIKA